jgi:hypothetical protein
MLTSTFFVSLVTLLSCLDAKVFKCVSSLNCRLSQQPSLILIHPSIHHRVALKKKPLDDKQLVSSFAHVQSLQVKYAGMAFDQKVLGESGAEHGVPLTDFMNAQYFGEM